MKDISKTLLIIALIISLIVNVFCVVTILKTVTPKTPDIPNNQSNQNKQNNQYDKTIELIKLARRITIYTHTKDEAGQNLNEEYRLAEEIWKSPDYCEFEYKTGDYRDRISCNYSTQTFDSIIEMICNGNPTIYKGENDEYGRWVIKEKPIQLQITTREDDGSYNNYLFIECDNIDEIYQKFVNLYERAIK